MSAAEIEADGWVTVHATGGLTRTEPFSERDIRAAIEVLRKNAIQPDGQGMLHFRPDVGFVQPPCGGTGVPGYRGPFR